jgi:hypothetical protein
VIKERSAFSTQLSAKPLGVLCDFFASFAFKPGLFNRKEREEVAKVAKFWLTADR